MNPVFERFPQVFDNGLPHVEGTTFRQAMVSADPWAGLFGAATFGDAIDDGTISTLLGTEASLFSFAPTLQWGQDGVVNWSVDVPNSIITLNMQHEVYWHDGVPLTLDDLVFAFELMADAEYLGGRFGTNERRILGIMDFHEGNADSISGLVLSNNNRTLDIHFDGIAPEILYAGLWSSPAPRHIFGHMSVADIPPSDEFRLNPVGWGPFIFVSTIPGESILMRRNENYVFGTPYIEYMVIERIHPDVVASAMVSGDFDFATFSAIQFQDHQTPSNFRYVASMVSTYDVIAFRFGYFDYDENVVVHEYDRLMHNRDLRRAMSMAINTQALGEQLFSGLRFPAGSFMSALHGAFMDINVPTLGYDPDRARQILDDAGFVVGADGYRTMPDGSDLTVQWAYITGEADDIIIGFFTQAWADIGVRVVLWQGRAHARLALWDILDFDDDNGEVHIYSTGWGSAGFNPNPSGRWGPNSWLNMARYGSAEWTALLDRLATDAMWDHDYMMQAYSDIQRHLYEQAPYFPYFWRTNVVALNNRVANWDTRIGIPPMESGIHTVRLTAANPY
jgi:peptide/nickel transport system substrate-binding protein